MTLVFRQWMRRRHGVHWHRARLLLQMGRGLGLFTGCAAGDTGMAVVIRVGDDA